MDYVNAFWVGGLICALVQILLDRTKMMPGRVMVLLVCTGAVLGFLNIYQPFTEFAGAGASVPLLGFGNTLWKGVKSGVASAMNTVISRIETAINSLIGGVNTVLKGFNSVVSAAAKVAKVKWSGVDLVPKVSLPKVKAYATGGFMDKYSIATVGENGLPEIMGTVGGKPAVAGSQEITGIKDAINSTSAQEVSLLRQQNQLLQAILQKNFGITTNDIGKAARDYGREHYNRTGDNVYVF